MKPVDVVASVLMFAIGAALLGIGLELRSNQAAHADGVIRTATTTSFETVNVYNRKRTSFKTRYRPVYTFETWPGETALYADPRTVRQPPPLGGTVKVSYRADDPGSARVVRGWHGWTTFPILFAAAGAAMLAGILYVEGRSLIRRRADRKA